MLSLSLSNKLKIFKILNNENHSVVERRKNAFLQKKLYWLKFIKSTVCPENGGTVRQM